MTYMPIQPTVRTPVLERTSKGRGEAHSDLAWITSIYRSLTLDVRSIHRGDNTHGLHERVNTSFRDEMDGKHGTSKHLLSPVKDCLETSWLAETYEAARRAIRARQGANRMAGVGRENKRRGIGYYRGRRRGDIYLPVAPIKG